MARLTDEPDLRRAMGCRARETAESVRKYYDRGEMIERVREEYASWLADTTRRERTLVRMRALQRGFFPRYAKRALLAAARRAKSALGTRP
jgi:hypothetical protein